MTNRKQRIKHLFEWLDRGSRLSMLDIYEVVGGFWTPIGEIADLEKSGFLVGEWVPGPYPRKRVYRRAP